MMCALSKVPGATRYAKEKPYRTKCNYSYNIFQRFIEESGHTRAECTTGCTIGNGADPCQLGLVDSEMRAGGAFKTLSIQDFL